MQTMIYFSMYAENKSIVYLLECRLSTWETTTLILIYIKLFYNIVRDRKFLNT